MGPPLFSLVEDRGPVDFLMCASLPNITQYCRQQYSDWSRTWTGLQSHKRPHITHGQAIQCLLQGFWRNIDHVIKVPYCFCFRSLRKRSAASMTLCVWSVTWCVTVVLCMAAVRPRSPALWQSARQLIRYLKFHEVTLFTYHWLAQECGNPSYRNLVLSHLTCGAGWFCIDFARLLAWHPGAIMSLPQWQWRNIGVVIQVGWGQHSELQKIDMIMSGC